MPRWHRAPGDNARVTELLTQVLPFAIGAAVSPTVLAIELLILTGAKRPKARTWAYLAGFALTLAILLLAFTFVLRTLSTSSQGPSPWARALDIVIALVLIALAIRQLHPAKSAGEKHQSKVQQRLESGGLGTYLVIGVGAMLSDASTIILLIPGAHLIATSSVDTEARLLVTLIVFLIVLLPLLIPIGALTLLGHRSDALLAKVNAWVTAHQRLINAIVALLIAALLLVNAFK